MLIEILNRVKRLYTEEQLATKAEAKAKAKAKAKAVPLTQFPDAELQAKARHPKT